MSKYELCDSDNFRLRFSYCVAYISSQKQHIYHGYCRNSKNKQAFQAELSYQGSAEDSDAPIEHLRKLPSKESKAGDKLSPTAKVMQKQRELRE